LKDAVLNYIALLGWSPKGDREIFKLDELIKEWDISGISKSPAIFDIQKLSYINGEYLKMMSLDEFHKLALPWIKQGVKRDCDTMLIAKMLQPRTEVLHDIPAQLDFLDELPDYTTELYVHKKMKTTEANSLEALKEVLPVLDALDDYSEEGVHAALFAVIERLGVKNGLILWPVRVALSGKQFTPGGGVEICALLGKEESLRRIKKGIELLVQFLN
ncbi:MAG: glutamate--tRNA ligase family protein, partial [Hydrogenoanaerobacterium sp.]